MSEYHKKVKILLDEFEAKGLQSIDVYVDEAKAAEAAGNAEAYYAELCRMLEGIKTGEGSKLVFNDSQKK